MAARSNNKKPRAGIVTILLLLVFVTIYNYNKFYNKPAPERTEEPAPKQTHSKKSRKKAPLRNLTTFTGKVIGIKDGDTFEVLYDSIPERVRLAEIDCPEKSQAFGKNAKQYASDLCFGKTVTVSSTGRDRYGRVVGTITTQDGTNVNEELVKAGFAWHYKQYSNNDQIDVLEDYAREQRLGLWADKNPTAPWDYRRNRRKK